MSPPDGGDDRTDIDAPLAQEVGVEALDRRQPSQIPRRQEARHALHPSEGLTCPGARMPRRACHPSTLYSRRDVPRAQLKYEGDGARGVRAYFSRVGQMLMAFVLPSGTPPPITPELRRAPIAHSTPPGGTTEPRRHSRPRDTTTRRPVGRGARASRRPSTTATATPARMSRRQRHEGYGKRRVRGVVRQLRWGHVWVWHGSLRGHRWPARGCRQRTQPCERPCSAHSHTAMRNPDRISQWSRNQTGICACG